MKNHFIILGILIMGLIVGSSAVSAAPPSPSKANVVVHPSVVHVGDTVVSLCEVIPVGNEGAAVGAIVYVQESLQVETRRRIRQFSDHGPFIWEFTMVAIAPGTADVGCQGFVEVGGELISAFDSTSVEILP